MFDDFLQALDGEVFDEIPVSIEEFTTSDRYLRLPPLSEYQSQCI